MNDLYTYQLETENKQLREALKLTRKTLEEQTKIIERLENEAEEHKKIVLNTKDMNITGGKYER